MFSCFIYSSSPQTQTRRLDEEKRRTPPSFLSCNSKIDAFICMVFFIFTLSSARFSSSLRHIYLSTTNSRSTKTNESKSMVEIEQTNNFKYFEQTDELPRDLSLNWFDQKNLDRKRSIPRRHVFLSNGDFRPIRNEFVLYSIGKSLLVEWSCRILVWIVQFFVRLDIRMKFIEKFHWKRADRDRSNNIDIYWPRLSLLCGKSKSYLEQ